MDCLVNLTGTSFDKVAEFQKKYRDDGILWFLESCDLNVMSIRRAMWHMKQAGWFENTKGFLIGRPFQLRPVRSGEGHCKGISRAGHYGRKYRTPPAFHAGYLWQSGRGSSA